MKKLIGSIDVYLDDSEAHEEFCQNCQQMHPAVSACKLDEQSMDVNGWPRKFRIELHPNSDETAPFMKRLSGLTAREKLQTILCHELGHAVSFMTEEPCQHRAYQTVYGRLACEQKAWEQAQKITGCYVDPTIRREALKSYAKHQAEEGQDMRMKREQAEYKLHYGRGLAMKQLRKVLEIPEPEVEQ